MPFNSRNYLCVAATSVASECDFSMSGSIVSAKHNQLSPERVDFSSKERRFNNAQCTCNAS